MPWATSVLMSMARRPDAASALLALGILACGAAARGEARAEVPAAIPAGVPSPTTLHVSPAGSDANAGTARAPFRTIGKAASLVNPGDTVLVGDGVDTDDDGDGAVFRVRRGGTPAAPVVFRAANRWKAKLDGQGGRTANGIDFDRGAGFVRIEGFEITGMANAGTLPSGRGSASGIDLYDGGHDVTIVGNHIHDIGRVCTRSSNTNGQVGIFVQQPNVVIEGNVVHGIGRLFPGERGCRYDAGFTGYRTLDHGVYLNGGSHGADGAVVRDNVFYDMQHGWAIQLYPGRLLAVRIEHNTFAVGNPARGHSAIVLDAELVSGTIAHNVFHTAPGGHAIEASDVSGTVTVRDNLTSGRAMTNVLYRRGLTVRDNATGAAIAFVDAARGDYRLRPGTATRDAGPRRDVGAHAH